MVKTIFFNWGDTYNSSPADLLKSVWEESYFFSRSTETMKTILHPLFLLSSDKAPGTVSSTAGTGLSTTS